MKKFACAFEGILSAYLSELSMKIHLISAVGVMLLGVYVHLNKIEWCIILLCIGLVWALEMVNTAIEAVVDLISPDYHPLAKVAKDVAAGAVLIMSIIAAICGMLIIINKLF